MADEEMQAPIGGQGKKMPQELKNKLLEIVAKSPMEREGENLDVIELDDEDIEFLESQLPEGLLDRACEELSDAVEDSLSDILREMATEKKILNKEQYKTLLAVYALFSVLCGEENKPEIKVYRAFNGCGVSVTAVVFEWDAHDISLLARALRNCETLSIVPEKSGSVWFSVTVKDVIMSAE
ncbi:MAG: hypothetical protein LUE21_09235 [Oscillospiraceae bacterium]|nr:hypothetical protein [Oscillospiraceae bacterium]